MCCTYDAMRADVHTLLHADFSFLQTEWTLYFCSCLKQKNLNQ